MRLHRLTVSAFGPFAGTAEVDFEPLNDAGVFLVTGPTGAGKTSVVDAVCFALYGVVPGERNVKRLRSDHAPADARPEVVLEFSVAGRRFVVRRTPEWVRPKRRGEGTTSERSFASLLEITDGTERLLSARAQEVGHFLSGLLGMSAGQFQQVAMLPQGRFQTFLHASSDDRQDALEQLFRTERFTRIEEWVHDRSRRLRAEAAEGEAVVRRVVDTMADRAAVECPEPWCDDRLWLAAECDQVLPWADQTLRTARRRLSAVERRHSAAQQHRARMESDHSDARRLHELRDRRDTARRSLHRLDEDGDVQLARTALEADARARRSSGLLTLLDAAVDLHAEASATLVAATTEAGLQDSDEASLSLALDSADQLLAASTGHRDRQRRLVGERTLLSRLSDERQALEPRLAALEEEQRTLPVLRRRLIKALAEARQSAGRAEGLRRELAAATARARAAALVAEAARREQDACERMREARDSSAQARERLLDLVARRLDGMAAELAGGLVDGVACRVCGSTCHPAPAAADPDGSATEEQHAAAGAAAEVARAAYDAAADAASQARLHVQRLQHEAGGLSAAAAEAAVAETAAALTAAQEAETAARALSAEVEAVESRCGELETGLAAVRAETVRLNQSLERQGGLVAALETEAAELGLPDEPVSDAVLSSLSARVELLSRLQDLATRERAAGREVQRLVDVLAAAAAADGFDAIGAVRAAVLDDAVRTRLEEDCARALRSRHEAEAVLADPQVLALPDQLPEPAEVAERLSGAIEDERSAARARFVQQECTEALATLRGRLEDALAAWRPARERFITADSMARLVRGMGADNQLQLRLSAYVLGARLDQVVAAANERLTAMREQRYMLERTPEPARRRTQAGLGLRVLDGWTGEARDPCSLSGGETFVVSLALALGLADVVSAETGGVRLETLFVDEGFGSLDPDTLDDVLDRLDELRAGGRTVGVISHVPELRSRIPAQLHVDKGRSGSALRLASLVG